PSSRGGRKQCMGESSQKPPYVCELVGTSCGCIDTKCARDLYPAKDVRVIPFMGKDDVGSGEYFVKVERSQKASRGWAESGRASSMTASVALREVVRADPPQAGGAGRMRSQAMSSHGPRRGVCEELRALSSIVRPSN